MKTNTYTIAEHYDPSANIAANADPAEEFATWQEFAAENPDDWKGDEFTLADFEKYIADKFAEFDAPIRALAMHLDCDPADISEERYDHYGMPIYSAEGGEYAVGTDSEADAAALEGVKSSLWAFNASFILDECGLPSALEDAIQAWQQKECESCNDDMEQLIEKCCEGGVKAFAESAISSDGRAHFLNTYDGDEDEETVEGVTYYIYRTN